MLSEEGKEAIERLNEILKEYEEIVNIEDKTEREIEMSLYMEDMPFAEIKTVLNLITKLQKENEKYKYLYQKALDNTIKSDREIEKLEKQSKVIDRQAQKYFEQTINLNKIIDLMADIFYKRFKAELLLEYGFESKEELKQYFERKVENER